MSNPIKTLKLTVADLDGQFRKNPPPNPKFFHFNKSTLEFHEADLITFTFDDGREVIMKDRFGTTTKK